MPSILVSCSEGVLAVTLGPATILVTDLQIQHRINCTTPCELVGLGGARLSLTPEQLAEFIGEYLRYTLDGHAVQVETKQVGYTFICESVPPANAKLF